MPWMPWNGLLTGPGPGADGTDMADTMDGLITFYSWHHAIRADKVLSEKGFRVALIPVPREYSSNCGTSLLLDYARRREAREVLEASRVRFEDVYPYVPELGPVLSGEEPKIGRRVRTWLVGLLGAGP